MSTNPLHIKAGLEPYTQALSRREVSHLLKRTSFGADPEKINALVGRTAEDVVNELIQFATDTVANPLPSKPSWADEPMPDRRVATSEEVRTYNENNRFWLDELTEELLSRFRTGGLRERMTLFWHDHFVTELEVYELAVYAYRYLNIIRTNSVGNFREFVRAMGLTPAMLIYLNGDANEKSSPNENYARELLELFTMSPVDRYGNANYTQTDVEEAARALTGWFVNKEAITTELFTKEFDEGEKTFLARTGTFDYNDVTDVIFDERSFQVADFICTKLYRAFVFDQPDLEVVQGLADIFRENDFEIEPVLSTLFKSAHFYDTQIIGAKIKSPADIIVGTLLETGFRPSSDSLGLLTVYSKDMEQILLDPPDVSGWQGNRAWLSTNTLPTRWSFADYLLFTGQNNQAIDLIGMASQLPDAEGPLSAFKLPLSIAKHFISVPLEDLDISELDDTFSGDLNAFPLPQEVLDGPAYAINIAKLFLGDVPWYEWSLEENGANGVLLNYVQFLMQLPEFQLT
ncbi:MAG: DUF1800 family protein [Rhodothermales bacterium]